MLTKRKLRVGIHVAAAVLVGVAGVCWTTGPKPKPKPLGQPIAADMLIVGGAADEATHITRRLPAVLLKSMFPKLYENPNEATAPTDLAKYRITFRYPDGRTQEVQITAKDADNKWHYGAGRFRVLGDLVLSLKLMPYAEAKGVGNPTPGPDDIARAQQWLKEHSDESIDDLLAWLRGENATHSYYAARWLYVPVGHPRRADVRKATLGMLRSHLKRHVAALNAADSSELDGWTTLGPFSELCTLIQAVADEKTPDRLTKMLAGTEAHYPAMYLLQALENFYGLPPSVDNGPGICGVGLSEARHEELRRAAHKRVLAGRARFLNWAEKYAHAEPAVRLQAVVDTWDAFMSEPEIYRRPWTDSGSQANSLCQPLLRFGDAIRPYVEAKRDQVTDPLSKGRFAYLALRLGGDVDDQLISALLNQPGEGQVIACDLLIFSGRTQFLADVEKLAAQIAAPIADHAENTAKVLRARMDARTR